LQILQHFTCTKQINAGALLTQHQVNVYIQVLTANMKHSRFWVQKLTSLQTLHVRSVLQEHSKTLLVSPVVSVALMALKRILDKQHVLFLLKNLYSEIKLVDVVLSMVEDGTQSKQSASAKQEHLLLTGQNRRPILTLQTIAIHRAATHTRIRVANLVHDSTGVYLPLRFAT
jgi:hypothetical protein